MTQFHVVNEIVRNTVHRVYGLSMGDVVRVLWVCFSHVALSGAWQYLQAVQVTPFAMQPRETWVLFRSISSMSGHYRVSWRLPYSKSPLSSSALPQVLPPTSNGSLQLGRVAYLGMWGTNVTLTTPEYFGKTVPRIRPSIATCVHAIIT